MFSDTDDYGMCITHAIQKLGESKGNMTADLSRYKGSFNQILSHNN